MMIDNMLVAHGRDVRGPRRIRVGNGGAIRRTAAENPIGSLKHMQGFRYTQQRIWWLTQGGNPPSRAVRSLLEGGRREACGAAHTAWLAPRHLSTTFRIRRDGRALQVVADAGALGRRRLSDTPAPSGVADRALLREEATAVGLPGRSSCAKAAGWRGKARPCSSPSGALRRLADANIVGRWRGYARAGRPARGRAWQYSKYRVEEQDGGRGAEEGKEYEGSRPSSLSGPALPSGTPRPEEDSSRPRAIRLRRASARCATRRSCGESFEPLCSLWQISCGTEGHP